MEVVTVEHGPYGPLLGKLNRLVSVETRNREGSMEAVTAEHGPYGPLLGKLNRLVFHEYGSTAEVRGKVRKGEISSLRSKLIWMYDALKEYAKLEDPNDQVKAWILRARELAYDTEDVFDKFIHLLSKCGRHHSGFKQFFRVTGRRLKAHGSRRSIPNQIKRLKARVDELKEQESSYKREGVKEPEEEQELKISNKPEQVEVSNSSYKLEQVREVKELNSSYKLEMKPKSSYKLVVVKEPNTSYKLEVEEPKGSYKLEELKEPNSSSYEIEELKEPKSSYKLDDIPCSSSSHAAGDPRLHTLLVKEVHPVGMEGLRDNLAKWMVKEGSSSAKHHRRVLSIVGIGGLGKTMLANEVYHNIQGHFDCHAFVSVWQEQDLNKIIKKVISQVIAQVTCQDGFTKYIDTWDQIKSIERLRELLEFKRYLVIIDDLWSTKAWETIKFAFPENNHSSRIITTTRIVDVAKSCCSGGNDRMYEMEALSDLYSRRLFFKRVFGSEEYPCSDIVKEVSNDILKKCGGLPLAIISASGILANKSAFKEVWEEAKRSIGYAPSPDKNQSIEIMNSILSLSYNDLSPNLRTCLLYLSIFPENYVIEREMLVRGWISEGFISDECGQNLEEVAVKYFYELVNKSMVQPVGIDCDGKARACRVHNMMLKFIISKSDEDNFTTVISDGQIGLANRYHCIRRLSVQHIDQEPTTVLANEDLTHVRSLTVTSSGCIKQLPSLVKFEALRVLHFEGCQSLEEYTMNMNKLFQLKYLSLRGTGISMLPPGIVKLHALEALDLRDTNINELPAAIVQLIKMQCLLISSEKGTQQGKVKIPNGISQMKNLRVISGFNINKSSLSAVEELADLTSLGELHVQLEDGGSNEYKGHEKMVISSLCNLASCKLWSLWIHKWRGSLKVRPPSSLKVFHMSGDYCGMDISKWTAPALTKLVHLSINLTELKEDSMRTLGGLPALLHLKLYLIADPKEMITVQGTGFQSLKKLVIYSVAGVYITFMVRAMPILENLEVRLSVSVAKVHNFRLGIQNLPRLKEAAVSLYKVDVTPSDVMAAAASIREEADSHLNSPTIDIRDEYNEVEEACSSSSPAARG